jgi:hypothetical protein
MYFDGIPMCKADTQSGAPAKNNAIKMMFFVAHIQLGIVAITF